MEGKVVKSGAQANDGRWMMVVRHHRQHGRQKSWGREKSSGRGRRGLDEEGGRKGCGDMQQSSNRKGAEKARRPLTAPPLPAAAGEFVRHRGEAARWSARL